MIYNYERLLRQVTYTNKKPAYYLKQSCLEVIISDCIFSQSININMLLQIVKKFPMQTEIVIKIFSWFQTISESNELRI